MSTRILMITHNRPAYTRLALERLLASADAATRVVVWDNASGPETREVLKSFEGRPGLEQVILHERNDMLRGPTNWFWSTLGDAEFVGKVDDDCLVPPDWIRVLSRAHRDISEAGLLACWIYFPEDFDEAVAAKKIFTYGPHRIMRNCFVGGSGYLMKRKVIEALGPLRENESFTSYGLRAATQGFINGWYYPFLYQEHMDDPRSEHSGMKTSEDFNRQRPLTSRTFKVEHIDEWAERLKRSARRLQAMSYDPRDYTGWRALLRRGANRFLGKDSFPRVR